MKAVVVDSRITDLFTGFDKEKEILSAAGIDLVIGNVTSREEYVDLCRDADALLLIGTSTPVEVINQLKNCKVIVRYGVGYDVVDVESCSRAGIVVCNIPDASTNEVAGHALALALACMRKIAYYDRMIRRGEWHSGSGYGIHRFANRIFGFCSFGRIARATAKYAESLGCRMIAYDPFVEEETFRNAGVSKVGFDGLLAQSDILSIHTPLSASTRHMFSKAQFDRMKPGMILVNTARGGLINHEHLLDAIDEGKVAAAGLDVYETEPLTDLSNRVFQYDTVILTPHCAAESAEYFTDLQEKVARTAIAVLAGGIPPNAVNGAAIRERRQCQKADSGGIA